MSEKVEKRDQRIRDMTTGNPAKLLFTFMLPLMGGNFLQQLYTVTDAAIVGKGVGVDALAAIGSTDWMYWFMLWAAVGFGQGFSILTANYFGEKNYSMLRKSVNGSLLLSLIAGMGLAVIGVICAGPMLHLLNTPKTIYHDAHIYVIIMYIGIFVVQQYNTISCILRALGDSKTPFIALLISTGLNISFDLLFVLVFQWGVAGAAAASGISQLVSGAYCFFVLRRMELLKSTAEEKRPGQHLLKKVWGRGLATAFQYAIIAIGGIVVQYALNSLGMVYVAGFTATNKLYGVLETISLAMGSAMMVYTSQNYGAQDLERIQKGTRVSLIFGIVTSLAMGLIRIDFGKRILMLFISASADIADDVLAVAYRYLFIMSIMLLALYAVNTYRSVVMGLNRMFLVVAGSASELMFRVIMAFLVIRMIGEQGIYFVEVTAWVGADLILVIGYYVVMHQLKKKGSLPKA